MRSRVLTTTEVLERERQEREWGEDGILRAALVNALEHYRGPDDDTVPVLLSWLAQMGPRVQLRPVEGSTGVEERER